MSFNYPSLPSTSAVLKHARKKTFRGNTFGQADIYSEVSEADRESADRLDVKKVLAKVRQQRIEADLPV
jgi:hypothetical protein